MTPPGPLKGPAAEIDTRLRAIAKARDLDAFVALIDPKAAMGGGGEEGPEGFRQLWVRDAEARAYFWTALDKMLAMGGVVDAEGALVYPWTDDRYQGELDPFSTYFDAEGHVFTRDIDACAEVEAPANLTFMVGPRMMLEQVKGAWRVVVLVEGD